MHIRFLELRLRNFKSHRELLLNLFQITRIIGTNGAGKSTIGEAITWGMYGTDPLGNSLIKQLSPEPVNYEYDRVEVHLLLSVDEKQVLLSRAIEGGETKYYVNEVPKKATQYKETVESLFDKNLFLSLFSPAYFFSQKWEDQRAQLLKNVLPPANKDVFAALPAPQADKLAELLKKASLDDLEAKHRDNKNRQEKALIAAKERVKTLREQLAALPPDVDEAARTAAKAELATLDEQITAEEAKQKQALVTNNRIERLNSDKNGVKERADQVKVQHARVKAAPIADHCDKCGQPLDEQSVAKVQEHKDRELATIKGQFDELKTKHSKLAEELEAIAATAADYDPSALRALIDKRHALGNQLQQSGAHDILHQQITAAETHEKATHESFTESVFILDAVKAFRAKEAELMAAKVTGLFQTLTLQLFQTNKGDGEQKPFFEVEKDGVPYRKLSTAEKIRAGLELIEVLSQQSDVIAPVFLDNAESIIKYTQPVGQLIECRVADQPLAITEVKV